jgi:hypothetical protein
MTVFSIEMLPAQKGDCLWIEYGELGRLHRIIVDGGTSPTFQRVLKRRIADLDPHERRFDLLIVTHVDIDHIGGVLRLLQDRRRLGLDFDDVWFNGYLDPVDLETADDDLLGFVEGEIFTQQLRDAGWPWNGAFHRRAVAVPTDGPLPSHRLRGGMKLTVLSPGPSQLKVLREKWDMIVRAADLVPGIPGDPLFELAHRRGISFDDDLLGEVELDLKNLAETTFISDRAVPNGSSIAVLAEFGGKRCLLTGDAFSGVLESSLRRYRQEQDLQLVSLDALKMPHHGSRGNISNRLLSLLACQRYLFSTNGAKFGAAPGHPDPEAVARVLSYGRKGGEAPILMFNYRSERNKVWDDTMMMNDHSYSVVYPPKGRILQLL